MSQNRAVWVIEKVGIDFAERRYNKRARGTLPACLRHGEDGLIADCVILDISISGAKVKFNHQQHVAIFCRCSELRLQVADVIDFPAEVVWQEGSLAGLRFRMDASDVASALANLVHMGPTGNKSNSAD